MTDFELETNHLMQRITELQTGPVDQNVDKVLEKLHCTVQDYCERWSYLGFEKRIWINQNIVAPLRELLNKHIPGSYIANSVIW